MNKVKNTGENKMTDKELIQQAFNALNKMTDLFPDSTGAHSQEAEDACNAALVVMADLAERLQAQPEREAHAVIAGALFDFTGWLTSRKERIVLSSTDDAEPAVEAIKQFAKMRGLSLDNANVQGWVKDRTANLGEIMGTEQLRQEMKQPEKTNQCAETCKRAKLCAVCGVSLSQDAVAWVYTNAKGRAVIVESDVKPYEDAMPLFRSEPQLEFQEFADEVRGNK